MPRRRKPASPFRYFTATTFPRSQPFSDSSNGYIPAVIPEDSSARGILRAVADDQPAPGMEDVTGLAIVLSVKHDRPVRPPVTGAKARSPRHAPQGTFTAIPGAMQRTLMTHSGVEGDASS
jgi:hypothetical protein